MPLGHTFILGYLIMQRITMRFREVGLSEYVEKLRAGDHAAFEVLYDAHVDSLYLFVIRFVKSAPLAEDVVQEAFIKIWEKRDAIDPLKSFKGYLFEIARNQSLNILKKSQTDERIRKEIILSAIKQCNSTEEATDFGEIQTRLQAGIDQLPHQQRKIFTLCKLHGLSYHQAANQLNLNVTTINTQMVNSLRFLRKYIIEK